MQIVLDRGERSDWFAAPWVVYFTFFSALFFILLLIHELRTPDPILDLRIFKIPAFSMSVCIVTVMVAVFYAVNLLNPLFLQELLGYTAWDAGLAGLPRGGGAGLCMLLVGQLSRFGFETRPLMGLGYALAAYAIWRMAGWTLQVSLTSIRLPILLFGCGSMGWPLLSAAALADVPRERIGFAASLYNMMRNTGAALGISMMSNLLTFFEQVHQTYLGQHFSVFDAWRYSNSVPRTPGALQLNVIPGLDPSHQQGLGMIYSTILSQATLLAYNDMYRMLAFTMILLIPTFLLFKKPQAGGGGGAH
jgi:DHA2 family multidrug resistance protein